MTNPPPNPPQVDNEQVTKEQAISIAERVWNENSQKFAETFAVKYIAQLSDLRAKNEALEAGCKKEQYFRLVLERDYNIVQSGAKAVEAELKELNEEMEMLHSHNDNLQIAIKGSQEQLTAAKARVAELEENQAEYIITACYFPHVNEVELTWESCDSGERVDLTAKVTKKQGDAIARLIPPCVYLKARAALAKNDGREG